MEKEMQPRTAEAVVALVGNPNVGKSTLFNALTGLRQHTGNWPGKTVSRAEGSYTYQNRSYTLVDLPGTYSLHPASPEEAVTRDYLAAGEADVTLVVADATCLTRNLALALQVAEATWPVVLCVNLLDEAGKAGITVDLPALEQAVGCPVAGVTARSGEGLPALRAAIARAVDTPPHRPSAGACCGADCGSCALARAKEIAARCVTEGGDPHRAQRRLDRLLTSRRTGLCVMVALLALVLWITIAGADLPSRLLSRALFSLQEPLRGLLRSLSAPWWLEGLVVDGLYRTVAWVTAVMLPPMAIFFPLFTLLEDAGYLPRVAFTLDHCFARSGAHGRQALTMCMGLGCNACGVTGCRIIDSPRERLIAILTNAFMPCNGRFPTLIALITLFFAGRGGLAGSLTGAAVLTALVVLAVGMTLLVSRLLSRTVLRGTPSAFALELPPYRMPRIGQVLIRSILDRTLFTLGRALTVAAPAGVVIWCAANLMVGEKSLLLALAELLEPIGTALGMDGVMLLSFLLGFPAGEIVLPCALMGYLASGSLVRYEGLSHLGAVLTANGWTTSTALSVILFTLFHFPCGTTCATIWKETRSAKWTAAAILLPTAVGTVLCVSVRLFSLLLA